jgi:hypothetical protein
MIQEPTDFNALNISPLNKCAVTDCDCPNFVANIWANTRCKNCMHHHQSHGKKPLNAAVASLQVEYSPRRQTQPNLNNTETLLAPRKKSSPAKIPFTRFVFPLRLLTSLDNLQHQLLFQV